ncbi:unnamed protein product [Hymenolepis diminuta]|uniref:Bromo domain-containing protein n=1 Tax=Hymenolepis diminuta TaxID=6216 RepID=A0A158QDF2_HYMDI|nr:unnamed protein product [Hymenolepis diminuta]
MSSEQSPIISVTSSGKRKVDDDEAASPHIPRLRPRRNVSINYNEHLDEGVHDIPKSRSSRRQRHDEGDETPEEDAVTPDGRRYPLRKRRQMFSFVMEQKEVYTPMRQHQDYYNHDHPESITPSLSDRDNEEAVRPDRYPPTSRPLKRPASRRNDRSEDQLEESYRRQAAEILRPMNFKSTEEPAPLRNRFIPNAGGTTASVEPIECFDSNVTFDEVAGLQEQIQTLRESVVLPLVYPELFQSKTIEPPRGVLFHGPPGTGKTLLARALANECTRMSSGEGLASTISGVSTANARPIAFFMRKGADVLSKWVGETERMLRDLFEEAHRLKPSIIFFDELDGLAPVRSSRQDQVHSSIVATLLSLMDGLDRRPGVVVIGATNRPDAIDPALRRPGRFDREFPFRLPNLDTRRRILQINTAKWDPKPDDQTTGYCGADMKALTAEACLCCLRRQYPQIYESKVKLDINLKYLVVDKVDWCRALRTIRPASIRAELDIGNASSAAEAAVAATARAAGGRTTNLATSPNSPQSLLLEPIIATITARIARALSGSEKFSTSGYESEKSMVSWDSGYRGAPNSSQALWNSPDLIQRVVVEDGILPSCVFPAVWQRLESVEVLTLNLASLYCGSVVSIMTSITQITAAAKRSLINQLPPHSTTFPGGHNSSDAASTSPHPLSNLQGVVIFAPRLDQLLSRLSAIQSQYLVERLLGVLATNSTSGVNFGRRLVLVATVKSLSPTALALPPPPLAEEVGKPSSTTASPQKAPGAALSVRVPTTTNNTIPLPLLNQRPLVNSNSNNNPMYFNNLNSQESPVVLNGHAPPKTVSMLREQQSPPPGSSGYLNNNVVTTTTNLGFREFSESSIIFESGDLSITSIHCDVEAQTENLPLGSSTTAAAAAAPSGITVDTLLRRVLRFPYVEKISLSPPVNSLRRKYLQSALLDWLEGKAHESAGFDLEAAAKRLPRPQEPTAIASILDQPRQTRAAVEEAKAIENRDRLLRRFRMALRNFLYNIRRDRRFTAFLRPVSKEDAPDYNRIIRRPMSVSQIRKKIDNDEYMSVEPFKGDLKLICTNALEYNPQDERAYEFQDAVDEAFDDDTTLTELGDALAEALTACPLPSHQNPHAAEAVGNGSQKNSSSPSSGRRYSRRLHLAKRKGSSVKGNDNEEVIPDDAPTPRAEMDQQSVTEGDSEPQPSNLPIDLGRLTFLSLLFMCCFKSCSISFNEMEWTQCVCHI